MKVYFDVEEVIAKHKDNLFSANHRNAMIERYGVTEAIWIKIEDLT